jgi:hypothetical protein
MKERPILFNGQMVNAILQDEKLVTRRIMTPGPLIEPDGRGLWYSREKDGWYSIQGQLQRNPDLTSELCPYGRIGDRLWVRETVDECTQDGTRFVRYRADGEISQHEWDYNRPYAPSIHMKKKHSRIMLGIRGVEVERLQDITEVDAKYEGAKPGFTDPLTGIVCSTPMYYYGFADLWNTTGGNWDENPWVWVVRFERL